MLEDEREARFREQEARAEVEQAEARRRRMRRQPWILIGLVNALVIGVGVTGVIDLRRLATPQGVALAWTQAAVFGQCDEYRRYSLPDPRSRSQVCDALEKATADARRRPSSIGIRLGRVQRSGQTSTVQITLSRPAEQTVTIDLRRSSGHWRVDRDAVTCASLACP